VGRWKFVLVAEDSAGQRAQDGIDVVVRQFQYARLFNHQFEVAFTMRKDIPLHGWKWTVG
jgi:hypothetical protein